MSLNFVPNKNVLISADRRGLLKLWEVNTCKLMGEKTPHCFPANIYLFKVNNGNTRKKREICLKLIIKLPERRQ